MKKDRRLVCPECGTEKFNRHHFFTDESQKKLRVFPSKKYMCANGHSFYTGDAIPKYKFKKTIRIKGRVKLR